MVKKWIIIIVIMVGLALGCYYEHKYVNKAFENMVSSLTQFTIMLDKTEENIDTKENVDYLNNLHQSFHENEKVLKALIWHTGLKDVEVGISRILTYVKENDYTEALAETNALLDYCKHYSNDFEISLENIL